MYRATPRPDTAWGRLCDRLDDAEDWMFDLPAFFAIPLMMVMGCAGLVLLALVIVIPLGLMGVFDGPSCASGTVRVTIESREMVTTGKYTHPGIVRRQVCLPEDEVRPR